MPSNEVLGILGGGQLGLMTALAASELGYRSHVFAPEEDSPAREMADWFTCASYEDDEALENFAKSVTVVTSEFENVPVEAMEQIATYVPVSPGVEALKIAQHRLAEKNLARKLGIATPDFFAITKAEDIFEPLSNMKQGAILKTCRFGYDGKGQARIANSDEAEAAFTSLNSADCILEELVEFNAEASFLVARTSEGKMAHFPPSINQHQDGILRLTEAPADPKILSPTFEKQGQEAVTSLAEHLQIIGLLAVEMFITEKSLLFNEMAPRPHNSFHWTIEGCATSQFAQLVRACMGLPLGSTQSQGRWQMENILGEDMPKLESAQIEEGAYIHDYGKKEARPGRKMAHITRKIG